MREATGLNHMLPEPLHRRVLERNALFFLTIGAALRV